MSDVRTDALADRYGTASPARRRAIIVTSGVVGVLALAWLAWAAWFQSTPEVQSSLRSFDVTDAHSVSAVVIVKPSSPDVSASCLVRAFGVDHSVVGELNFKVAGEKAAISRTVNLRTEREATSVELVGCTAKGQSRPR
ncbi:MAG: hypothetical protein JWR85_1536 [Marmoricola sp.]|nr:hypothetical protein [Marmoricola sp.]